MAKPFNTALTALFLQSAFEDSAEEYEKGLHNALLPHWDTIVLTASDQLQAEGYRRQIDHRKKTGRLPDATDFMVVPDEGDKRVGSAGSTLTVISRLKEKYGGLAGKKILVIHAGGNSSRCPQYSALGKLFAPLPTNANGAPATIFDMFMITMASVPGRLKDGMLLLSGDVTLFFNPLQCDFGSAEAAVISFKENVETGKDHGVYVKNPVTGNVKKFLHKQTVERLCAEGAVDERRMCSIDTGAIWLGPAILEKLYSLVDTEDKYRKVVNDRVRLSLYSDIAYCLAEDSTLEKFQKETPEGSFCPELTEVREALWKAIGSYTMKLMNLAPAKFVHFGSIPEIMELMNAGVEEYALLGWKKQTGSSAPDERIAAYTSVISRNAEIGSGCYMEVSYIHSGAVIGENTYISFADIHSGEVIPPDVLLHGLKETNGKFVCRIMGIRDNPKKGELFGYPLTMAEEKLGVKLGDTLWDAELYPECETIREAVAAALNLHALVCGRGGSPEAWRKAPKKSLCSGFHDADPQAIIDWQSRMEELVRMDELKKAILNGTPAAQVKGILNADQLTKIQQNWLENELGKLDTAKLEDFSYAMRLYYYLGAALNDERYTAACFRLIADTVLQTTLRNLRYNESARIVSDETTVRLPLRVNWGGGWSDTCPYCLENGGAVLNAAIRLRGELPVEVRLVRIAEKKIVFDSRDMDVHCEFTSIEELQQTGDPYDRFALQKACLLACGIIPKEGGDLDEILTRLGGGFEMHSEVTGVPKGSGLGTSSILAAAAVKALLEFTGCAYNDDTLYATVLAMEQIMSTGGGWQDQVGGVAPGVKFITSKPGIEQKLKVEKVEIAEETMRELNERFCLISSGQRRLARNLLRDVVGRYVGNEPDSLEAHKEIQKTAALMRFALERGDIDEFARLMEAHWKLSRMIDKGSSNTLIDQIFLSVEDLIDARMVCGAGGGGFLQVILKKGVKKETVEKRLKEVFQDFAVDVWECEC